jgi:hypothetical protein
MGALLKWSSVVVIGMAVGCYTAFVAECYWNWFVVPALHASEVSFLQMLGLIWLLQLVTSRSTAPEDKKWQLLASAIELCVPPEKQEQLADLTKPNSLDLFLQSFSQVFGQLTGNTFMLVAGFVLHMFV